MSPQGSQRVLWVTDEPVDRELSGGSIRQSHLFEALASAYETDLLTVGDVLDERTRSLAASVTEVQAKPGIRSEHPVGRRIVNLAVLLGSEFPSQVHGTYPVRRALSRAIAERQGRYDLVCVEHEALAPLIRTRRHGRWIITLHHLLSGMIASDIDLAPGRRQLWYRQRDKRKAEALERRIVGDFDHCVVCSKEDATELARISQVQEEGRISVIPNGVDVSRFRPVPIPAEPRVLFPGNFAYGPNVDGAVWFCSEVWPRIVAAVPGASVTFAGRRPRPAVTALERLPGVTVAPDVPSMVPYFESARVVIVPVRLGTGTRLKALEAMGAGRPVVGTTVGLGGIGVIDGVQARVADDPDSFAAAVVGVLQGDEVAESLGQAGRAHVTGRFEWDRIGARFVDLVSEILASGEPSHRVATPGPTVQAS